MKVRFRGGMMHGIDLEFVSAAIITGSIIANGETYVDTGTTDGDYTVFEVVRPV
jgi:hypothetical protein